MFWREVKFIQTHGKLVANFQITVIYTKSSIIQTQKTILSVRNKPILSPYITSYKSWRRYTYATHWSIMATSKRLVQITPCTWLCVCRPACWVPVAKMVQREQSEHVLWINSCNFKRIWKLKNTLIYTNVYQIDRFSCFFFYNIILHAQTNRYRLFFSCGINQSWAFK